MKLLPILVMALLAGCGNGRPSPKLVTTSSFSEIVEHLKSMDVSMSKHDDETVSEENRWLSSKVKTNLHDFGQVASAETVSPILRAYACSMIASSGEGQSLELLLEISESQASSRPVQTGMLSWFREAWSKNPNPSLKNSLIEATRRCILEARSISRSQIDFLRSIDSDFLETLEKRGQQIVEREENFSAVLLELENFLNVSEIAKRHKAELFNTKQAN